MLVRSIVTGVAVLALAEPAMAQQRGAVEFGVFASAASFDNELGMESGWGGGGRIGVFVVPRLSLEFEGGGSSAGRSGLPSVNVGVLSARLTAVVLKSSRVSVLLGTGIEHTDTYFVESYGPHGLLGLKVALGAGAALRIDGIVSRLANGGFTNTSLHAGVSLYRSPAGRASPGIVSLVVPPRDTATSPETRDLRLVAASYRALRDSLSRPNLPLPPSSSENLTTMQEMIYFQNDRSDLSDGAKVILGDKVTVFQANPTMRILIVGFASQPGAPEYNMALGLRRAESARTYLVSRGVASNRIEIATRGAGQLLVDGPGEAADAANRRGQFRLLVADPLLVVPRE